MITKKHLNTTVCAFMSVMTIQTALSTGAVTSPSKYSPSAETVAFIRNIQKELGLEKMRLDIFRMSDKEKRYYIRRNACVTLDNTLVIDEEWFNELSEDEKRALIGHELMHIKKDHIFKRPLISGLLLGTALVLFMIDAEYNQRVNFEKTMQTFLNKTLIVPVDKPPLKIQIIRLSSWLLPFINLWHSRACEREADLESAKQLHCARGGKLLFTRMLGEYKATPRCLIHSLLSFIGRMRIFSTHPTHEQRIKYFNQLIIEQEKTEESKDQLALATE